MEIQTFAILDGRGVVFSVLLRIKFFTTENV